MLTRFDRKTLMNVEDDVVGKMMGRDLGARCARTITCLTWYVLVESSRSSPEELLSTRQVKIRFGVQTRQSLLS